MARNPSQAKRLADKYRTECASLDDLILDFWTSQSEKTVDSFGLAKPRLQGKGHFGRDVPPQVIVLTGLGLVKRRYITHALEYAGIGLQLHTRNRSVYEGNEGAMRTILALPASALQGG